MIDVCAVMYRNGYRLVSVGAMMRLLGIDEEAAARHDDEMFELGAEFEELMRLRESDSKQEPIESCTPAGVTLH